MISLIHAKKPRQIASGGIAFCDVITEFLFKQGYIIEKRKKGAAEMAAVNLNTEKCRCSAKKKKQKQPLPNDTWSALDDLKL